MNFLIVAISIGLIYFESGANSSPLQGRIVNGEMAKHGQFPYQALLFIQRQFNQAVCGGSLIHPSWIITAAHCAIDASSFEVHLGAHEFANNKENGRVIVQSSTAIVHEKYDPHTLLNDVALIKLPSPVELTNENAIKVVKLPRKADGDSVNELAVTSGWGKEHTSSTSVAKTLNFATLRIISNKICNEIYSETANEKSTICARGEHSESVCSGDSGGPLVLNATQTLVGITSFGSRLGCDSGIPQGFTRVKYYLDWIAKKTGLSL